MQIFHGYRRKFLWLPSILEQCHLKRKFRANNSILSEMRVMKFIPFCYFKPLTEQKLQEVNTYTDERYLSDNSSEQGNVLVLSKNKAIILFAYSILKTDIVNELHYNCAIFIIIGSQELSHF